MVKRGKPPARSSSSPRSRKRAASSPPAATREATLPGWALARLAWVAAATSPAGEGGAGAGGAAPVAAPAAPALDDRLARVAAHFGLAPAERVALQLVFAVERSVAAGRAARALTGSSGLTVELLLAAVPEAAAPAPGTAAAPAAMGAGGPAGERATADLLAASGRLRAHALLEVGCAPAALAAAHDPVRLAAGVARHLAGLDLAPEELGLGVQRVAPADRGPVPEALAAMVRDDFLGAEPRWTALSGLGLAEGERVVAAIARRLGRPALRVDGRVVARLAAREAFALLAALRREADLGETLLAVDHAGWLVGLLGALTAPPAGAVRVLLADEARVPDLATPGGFTTRALTLEGTAAAPQSPGPGARPDGATPTAGSPAIEAARRQAALDAARAMGRPLDPPPGPGPGAAPALAAPATPPSREAASHATPASAPTEPARPTASPSTPASPAAAPTPTAAAPAPAPAAAPERPLTRDEMRERAFAHVGSAVPARRRPPAERPASPSPAASASAATAASPPSAAAPTDGGSGVAPTTGPAADGGPGAGTDPAEALPYLPVPDDAPLAELLRVVRETPNPLQRAALLRKLADAGVRETAFVALLRAYLKVDHPAVRSAAEHGMTCLFGPMWNRARPIPKPVQPPRSDDDR